MPGGRKQGPCLLVVAFVLLGCSLVGEPAHLAVRTDIYTPHCHTSFTIGTLVPDPDMGTAIIEDTDSGGRRVPVRWPEGFTARRLGDVIVVFNQAGAEIARTGQHYKFLGGYGEDAWRGCGDVIPEPR